MDIITLYYILLALFSLCVGSFLNVIIYRLPFMLHADAENTNTCLNLCVPRSFCPHCKTPIKYRHNLPVLGFFLLKRRCFFCHQPIAWRYPLVEAVTCLLTVTTAWLFGFNLGGLFAVGFVWLLIPLFFIDIEHQLLPDSLTLTLLWLGLLANTQGLFTPINEAVLSVIGAYLFLWLFIHSYYLITHKVGMGHGDFKLFAALAAWFGWSFLPLILLVSSLTGAIFGITYLKINKQNKDTPIAFGPFLCIAGLIVLYYQTLN